MARGFAHSRSSTSVGPLIFRRPVGPTIAVMPARNKSFGVLQQGQETCESYAGQRAGKLRTIVLWEPVPR
jgi:hypothetical protein